MNIMTIHHQLHQGNSIYCDHTMPNFYSPLWPDGLEVQCTDLMPWSTALLAIHERLIIQLIVLQFVKLILLDFPAKQLLAKMLKEFSLSCFCFRLPFQHLLLFPMQLPFQSISLYVYKWEAHAPRIMLFLEDKAIKSPAQILDTHTRHHIPFIKTHIFCSKLLRFKRG